MSSVVAAWLVAFCIIRNDQLSLAREIATIEKEIDYQKTTAKFFSMRICQMRDHYRLRDRLAQMESKLQPVDLRRVETISPAGTTRPMGGSVAVTNR